MSRNENPSYEKDLKQIEAQVKDARHLVIPSEDLRARITDVVNELRVERKISCVVRRTGVLCLVAVLLASVSMFYFSTYDQRLAGVSGESILRSALERCDRTGEPLDWVLADIVHQMRSNQSGNPEGNLSTANVSTWHKPK
ncbi:MAG: hypothetical protein KDB03_25585 [Planctomycetales bacterium]|nr:hypothetical protein [Planctomycetales bacterium]